MNESTLRFPVLAQKVWPENSLRQSLILVVAGSWLIALMAQIQLPMWPVPITGQTFAVLLVAAVLGSRRGAAAVLLYLGQGAAGLPVFAAGGAGLAVFFGPTAGYLAGFIFAAFVVGRLAEKGWDRRLETAVVAMLIGNLIIYACGLFWLRNFVPVDQLFAVGLLPFVPGDIIKIVLAALLLPGSWRFLRHRAS